MRRGILGAVSGSLGFGLLYLVMYFDLTPISAFLIGAAWALAVMYLLIGAGGKRSEKTPTTEDSFDETTGVDERSDRRE